MSRGSERDPWDEVGGIPPTLKELRAAITEERSWRKTLLELREIGVWLTVWLGEMNLSIGRTFDGFIQEIAEEQRDPGSAAYKMYALIQQMVTWHLEEVFTVLTLFRALSQKLEEELTEALQASQSGLDE